VLKPLLQMSGGPLKIRNIVNIVCDGWPTQHVIHILYTTATHLFLCFVCIISRSVLILSFIVHADVFKCIVMWCFVTLFCFHVCFSCRLKEMMELMWHGKDQCRPRGCKSKPDFFKAGHHTRRLNLNLVFFIPEFVLCYIVLRCFSCMPPNFNIV